MPDATSKFNGSKIPAWKATQTLIEALAEQERSNQFGNTPQSRGKISALYFCNFCPGATLLNTDPRETKALSSHRTTLSDAEVKSLDAAPNSDFLWQTVRQLTWICYPQRTVNPENVFMYLMERNFKKLTSAEIKRIEARIYSILYTRTYAFLW
ncbi:MAG TPA: hypothetical protein VGG19_09915 [Tepidisphaeraceae bacterium]|jgi:hypothetical protein